MDTRSKTLQVLCPLVLLGSLFGCEPKQAALLSTDPYDSQASESPERGIASDVAPKQGSFVSFMYLLAPSPSFDFTAKLHVGDDEEPSSMLSLGTTFKVKNKDTGQFIALDNGNVVLVSSSGSAVSFMDDGKMWQISATQFLAVNGSNRVVVASNESTNWNSWVSGNPIEYNGYDVHVVYDAGLGKDVLEVYTNSTTGPDFEAIPDN